MIPAFLAALALTLPVQSTPCGERGDSGPFVGRVVHVGPSADLSPIGYGACTGTAWVDPLGWEVALPTIQ